MTQQPFPPPPGQQVVMHAPKKPRRWPWITGIAVAFFVGIGVGAAGNTGPTSDAPSTAADDGFPSETTATGTSEPIAEEPAPTPDPDVEYGSSCDYVLGDFSENPKTGYRFLADASLDNTGNIGAVVKVTAVWYLGGGDKITKTKSVKVAYGVTGKRVGFTVPASQDDIDRHQSVSDSGDTCEVKAAVVDIFGEAQ